MALSQVPGSTPAGGPSTMAAPPESVTPWDFKHSDRPPCADGAAVVVSVAGDGDVTAGGVVAADDRCGSGVDAFGEQALSNTVAVMAATVDIRLIR